MDTGRTLPGRATGRLPPPGPHPLACGMARSRGFTVVELVVVLAIVAIAAGTAFAVFRPSHAGRSARAYRTALQGARIAAMGGAPTSVRWDAQRAAFLIRHGAGDCSGAVRAELRPAARVAVVRRLRDGVAWLPDGSGRACGGGGVYGGRVRFEDRRERWDVVVASTGRIRIEAAP